ncbi:hypothetical protein [Pedobacter immunditicola]|uniref:hypothetical protein n=1 Tax=Pedobacter immunditicola TaxID=3133440 RepID=UPI0030B51D4F
MAKQTFLTDIDLSQNQLINATLQNLAVAPSTAALKAGYVYFNTADKTTYQWTGVAWLNLGDIYVHPTQTAINPTLTGANVLTALSVNTLGHVTSATSALLTPAIIGAEPSITAGTTAQFWRGDKSWQTLNTSAVPEGTNQYFTTARVNAVAPTLTGTGASGSWGINITGSAPTLTTARTLWGQSFNGSANIAGALTGITSAAGTGTADFALFYGNSSDTALAPSFSFTSDPNTGMWNGGAADTLGFTTGGVNRFSINTTGITSSLPITATVFNGAGTGLTGTAASFNIGGNSATATKLTTARTLWGVSFDGTANIAGALSSVTNITMSGTLSGATDIRIPVAKAAGVNAGSLWVGDGASAGVIVANTLGSLSDVIVGGAVANQALVFNGTNWTNQVVTSVNDFSTNTTQTWSSQKITNTIADINSTITGGLVNKGGYDAGANSPMLDVTPIAGIKNGWTYVITVAGTFFTENVQVGDMIVAKQDNPTTLAHWLVVNKNIADIVQASTGSQGIIQLANQTEVNAGVDANKAVTPATLQAKVATDAALGLIEIATQAEVNAGTDYSRAITPLTMKTYITGYVGGYAATFGNASLTSFDFTHNLNTTDVTIQIIEVSTGETVIMQSRRSSANVVNVQCNIAPATNQYRVIIKK